MFVARAVSMMVGGRRLAARASGGLASCPSSLRLVQRVQSQFSLAVPALATRIGSVCRRVGSCTSARQSMSLSIRTARGTRRRELEGLLGKPTRKKNWLARLIEGGLRSVQSLKEVSGGGAGEPLTNTASFGQVGTRKKGRSGGAVVHEAKSITVSGTAPKKQANSCSCAVKKHCLQAGIAASR